jgi:hypothetical protein
MFAGKPAPTRFVVDSRPEEATADGLMANFLHIYPLTGTNLALCCHTCAKTQHKPLSQKKMHAQIARMENCPVHALTACRHGG